VASGLTVVLVNSGVGCRGKGVVLRIERVKALLEKQRWKADKEEQLRE
jgi:hypothetical protein